MQGANFGFFYVVGSTETPITLTDQTLKGALDWIEGHATTAGYATYAIQLDTNETLSGKRVLSYAGTAVEVRIRGYSAVTVTGGTADGLFEVGSGVTLVLGNHLTVSGAGLALTDYAGFILVNGGVLEMHAGSTISGLDVYQDCGAVVVGAMSSIAPASAFKMLGGEISGNITSIPGAEETPSSHGAVLLRRNGQFTMSGGSITNNTRGVVIAGPQASFTMSGGSITGNGKIIENGAVTVPANGMRAAGVCVGQNLYVGTFTMTGGEISGNGGPGVGTALPPGGGVYVSSKASSLILKGVVTINPNNTVCLTSASSGECPAITLGPGFTVSNPKIALDLASTRPEWVIKWVDKTVLKLDGSGDTIANLKLRFDLRNFYYSSGNKNFELYQDADLSGDYMIDDQGILVLKPQPNPSA